MRFDTSLQQRMSMKQILAPRMIQSMEILQLASMDLAEHIEQEWEENPVLGIHDGNQDASEEMPALDRETEEAHEASREIENEYEEFADDWDDDRAEFRSSRSQTGMEDEGERKLDAMQNMVSRPQSLQDYLIEQLEFQELEPKIKALVEHLIANLRDNGYLPDLSSVMNNFPIPVSQAEIDRSIRILQQMEPPGVGARDLRECLLLQIEPDMPHRDVVRNLILNHLDDVMNNRLPIIHKKTGLDHETIQEAIEQLKRLNPNPGAGFDTASIPYVTPDVRVELDENGEFQVTVVDDYLPDVYIKRSWLERVKRKDIDPKERDYLRKKIQSAQWLIEAILQRRNTLKLVTQAIVEHQRAFLEKKAEHINPLKMQQIADQVGRHVTTISRAVDEKWVETPRGIFPLKRFFGGGTTTAEGEEIAWEQIKSKLNELISNEDKANPLSDEDLVEKLQAAGFPVARRTVTKYRKLMNIPSSRQRRAWGE
ncbi:MAG TPA: RNA polymerase factor sigma-54 [Gemmatales bacterium]|nr:RNA polymerase factor sigma-54 [Gemmatales bacterium]